MIGIYFSGTGNSRHAVTTFLKEYDSSAKAFSIEDKDVIIIIKQADEMIFGYPVQYSTVPKILRDFIEQNNDLWQGKRVLVIATMGLFSGDGAGVLGRLLQKYGSEIIGGLHLKMPDSIADEKVLKRSSEKNKELVKHAEKKIEMAVEALKAGKPTREGLGFLSRLIGLFGQRLYFRGKTKMYTDKININSAKCIGCGKCESLCPMENITVKDKVAVAGNKCTMCYRCINSCPKEAITLLGKQVITQSVIEKFL